MDFELEIYKNNRKYFIKFELVKCEYVETSVEDTFGCHIHLNDLWVQIFSINIDNFAKVLCIFGENR